MAEYTDHSADPDYRAWKNTVNELARLQGQKWAAWHIHGEESPEAAVLVQLVDTLSDQSGWPDSWREFDAAANTNPQHQDEFLGLAHATYCQARIEHERAKAQRPRPTFAELQTARHIATAANPLAAPGANHWPLAASAYQSPAVLPVPTPQRTTQTYPAARRR